MNEFCRAGHELDAKTFAAIRRRTILEGCKWDPQVEDVSTLARFPLIMRASIWKSLARSAELLATEAVAAESEILQKPKLLEGLGLPRRLLNVLRADEQVSPAALRVIRFDFHPTTAGWRISEANSDVPGGYSEGSFFTGLVNAEFPELRPAGNPGASFAEQLLRNTEGQGTVALMAAPGYMEDQQVISFLAKNIRERNCAATLCQPSQLEWRGGDAFLHGDRVRALVRFFQSEWLAKLQNSFGWRNYFRGGNTPLANPGSAIVTESKRFPLIWNELSTELPTWRALLPETRDPREVPWRADESWILKTAFCNTGDTVSIRALMKSCEWARAQWSARFFPNQWIAQRRFESVPIETPDGPRHVCVGVYTIDGRAAGAYCRLSPKPLIDFAATDVALLLEKDE